MTLRCYTFLMGVCVQTFAQTTHDPRELLRQMIRGDKSAGVSASFLGHPVVDGAQTASYYFSSVTNAADYHFATSLSSREMITIFGKFPIPTAKLADPLQDLPENIQGVQAYFFGLAGNLLGMGKLLYVSPDQINLIVPELGPPKLVLVELSVNNFPMLGNLKTFPVQEANPALFEGFSLSIDPPCPKDAEQCREPNLVLHLIGTGAGGRVLSDTYGVGEWIPSPISIRVESEVEVFVDGRRIETAVNLRLAVGNSGADEWLISVSGDRTQSLSPGIHFVNILVGGQNTNPVRVDIP